MPKVKRTLGAREVKEKDISRLIEDLPSNKTLYVAQLNNDDDPDVTPTKCRNIDEVFKAYKPRAEASLETTAGETANAEFSFNSISEFGSRNLIEKNEYLKKTYLEKEIIRDLDKQLSKNVTLQKTLKDPKKKEDFLKAVDSFIRLLTR